MGAFESAASKNAAAVGQKDSTFCAFFYGTLMAPEVFFTVCYNVSGPVPPSLAKEHKFQPALLHGYSRRRVQHADYPGITEQEGHVVRGTLATGLTQANIYRLDYFEGSEYERRKVKVRLLANASANGDEPGREQGEEVETDVYVFKNPAYLEEREWDYDEFRRDKMRKWTRADYVFDGCDEEDRASVAP